MSLQYKNKPAIILEKDNIIHKLFYDNKIILALVFDNQYVIDIEDYDKYAYLEYENLLTERIKPSDIDNIIHNKWINRYIKMRLINCAIPKIENIEYIKKITIENDLYIGEMDIIYNLLINKTNNKKLIVDFYFIVKFFGTSQDFYLLKKLKQLI